MFNGTRISRLERYIEDLENNVKTREATINQLKQQIADMQAAKVDAIKEDVNTSEFGIKWDSMDVFSIERMGDHMSAYTVLGHWIKDSDGVKSINEWKFYCSHEQHQKLAEEFKRASGK